jgi:hypothetical protein
MPAGSPIRTELNSRCQRGPNHPCEIGAEVGLRQQHAGVEPAMMHNGVFGIGRREKDLELRAWLLRLDRGLTAVHAPGHDHVGEQQIDALGTIDDRQRLGAVAGGQRVVAETADLRHDVFADRRVVLDNQDGFVAAFDFGDASLGGLRRSKVDSSSIS